MHYVLGSGEEPVLCDDVIEWAKTKERQFVRGIIGKNQIPTEDDSWCELSTVFLWTDYGCGYDGPELYETLLRGGNQDYCVRYATRKQAIEGHYKALDALRNGEKLDED